MRYLVLLRHLLVLFLRWAVIVLFGLLLTVVIAGVVSRFLANFSVWLTQHGIKGFDFLPRGQIRWSEEAAVYLLLWSSLLGSAAAFDAKSHLGLDYLISKLHPGAQQLAEMVVYVISGIFAAVVMVGGGVVLVSETLYAGQRSAAMGLPVGWLYAAVPIAGFFFLLFSVEQLIKILFIIKSKNAKNANTL